MKCVYSINRSKWQWIATYENRSRMNSKSVPAWANIALSLILAIKHIIASIKLRAMLGPLDDQYALALCLSPALLVMCGFEIGWHTAHMGLPWGYLVAETHHQQFISHMRSISLSTHVIHRYCQVDPSWVSDTWRKCVYRYVWYKNIFELNLIAGVLLKDCENNWWINN